MSSGRHRATTPSARPSRPVRPTAPRVATQSQHRSGAVGFRRAAATSTAIVAAAGLSLTMVVPANAATLETPAGEATDTSAIATVPSADTNTGRMQTMEVASSVTSASTARDGFSSSSASAAARAIAVAKAAAVTTILSSSTSSTSTSTAATTATASTSGATVGEEIVASAEQYVGKVPYVIDGSTPSTGFDCSGLVQYVFAEYGIAMEHDVDAEAALGTVISASEARPGDLVVYAHEHIGIYVGSGDMVDAPHVGLDVQVQAVWGSPTYVRIPNT